VLAAAATVASGCDDRPPPVCPDDMTLVEGFGVLACVDLHEASRGEADEAVSAPGARPWTVLTWDEAQAACEAAGKRLCTDVEWAKACEGPDSGSGVWPKYPYGVELEPGRCNDGTAGSGIERTGRMEACEGGYDGLFDMSGNAAEWVDRCDGGLCFVQGGSYEDTSELDLSCNVLVSLDPTRVGGEVGFRCCLTP
jgi:formylglycine-generating enzyme required for sulfatase activity